MLEMLRKMSTKNKADMPVSVNIPSKEVYDLLKDQMDTTKKELNSQIGELVESQIDNLREQLKEQIEVMAQYKYNVFHWHLTDYQGFRIESKLFPKLHTLGSQGNYYTQEDVREIVAFAA